MAYIDRVEHGGVHLMTEQKEHCSVVVLIFCISTTIAAAEASAPRHQMMRIRSCVDGPGRRVNRDCLRDQKINEYSSLVLIISSIYTTLCAQCPPRMQWMAPPLDNHSLPANEQSDVRWNFKIVYFIYHSTEWRSAAPFRWARQECRPGDGGVP